MSATHGSVVPSRSLGRLIGCCFALAMLVSALFASSASAKPPPKPTAYVAIGDSISFGYKEATFYDESTYPTFVAPPTGKFFNLEAGEPTSAFEAGFVGVAAGKLYTREKSAGNKLETVNLGCPGETSDGVIGHNVALGGGAGTEYNPCAYHNADGFPLKYPYGGASQLEAAIGAVTTKDVTAVSINIGSNDELAVVADCLNPAYLAAHGFVGGPNECLAHEAGPSSYIYPGYGLFGHIISNTGHVIGALRAYGYTGPVVVLGFYNPESYALPNSDALQKSLNETFEYYIYVSGEPVWTGVRYANPFTTINPQTNKEKKAIEKYTEFYNPFDEELNQWKEGNKVGDIHPTAKGYKLLGELVWGGGAF